MDFFTDNTDNMKQSTTMFVMFKCYLICKNLCRTAGSTSVRLETVRGKLGAEMQPSKWQVGLSRLPCYVFFLCMLS